MSDPHSDQKLLPGPPALFFCGYDFASAAPLLQTWIAGLGYAALQLIFCTKEMLDGSLDAALAGTTPAGVPLAAEQLPAVCVVSGLPLSFLHILLERFHETKLVRPIFATTTSSNLSFTVKELLRHLLEERKQQQTVSRRE